MSAAIRYASARLAEDKPTTAADVAGELRRAIAVIASACDATGMIDFDDICEALDDLSEIADGLHPGGAR